VVVRRLPHTAHREVIPSILLLPENRTRAVAVVYHS
jgi:hypothetical protein